MKKVAINTVDRVRESLEAVVLMAPEKILYLEKSAIAEVCSVLHFPAAIELAATSSWDQFSSRVRAALAALPFAVGARPGLQARLVISAEDPHDAYFRVARTAEVGASAYARGLLQGLSVWATDAWDGARSHDSQMIGNSLISLWQDAANRTPCVMNMKMCSPDIHHEQMVSVPDDDAVHRWIRGHQVFAVLTQGLIATVNGLRRAADAGDWAALERATGCIGRLYQASAAAFRYASDFRPEQYLEVIRPSMSEPHTPAGFSGSLSADHGELVRCLAASGDALAKAALVCPVPYAAMKQALGELYEDHKRVCARMAGADGPSLRSLGLSHPSAATDMLDRFKSRRMAMLS